MGAYTPKQISVDIGAIEEAARVLMVFARDEFPTATPLHEAFVGAVILDGRVPTDRECELLVCGDGENEPPEKLRRKFPHLDTYILNSLA